MVIAVLVFAHVVSASASPGDLDPSFGENGVHRISFSDEAGDWSVGSLIGTQPSGRPLLAGIVKTVISGHDIFQVYGTFAAARLNDQGGLDPSFGDAGLRIGGLGFAEDYSDHFPFTALAPDGKIVVGARGADYNTFSVARLDADGAIDPDFAGDGVATFSLPEPSRFGGDSRVAVLSDGSVILAGIDYGGNGFDNKLILIKFTADGTLDRSFGTDGVISTTSEPTRSVNDLVIDSEDRILISDGIGRGLFEGNPESISEVTRLLPNGQPDTTFGTAGTQRVTTPTDGVPYPDSPRLALDSDQRIYSLEGTSLTRLNENGSPDASFGTAGTVELPADFGVSAIYPDPGGGVFVAGTRDEFRAHTNLTTALIVGHLLEDGNIDTDFGDNGWSRTYHDGSISGPSMLKLSSNRLIVAASGKSMLVAGLQLGADGVSDADADGVGDEIDRCPERSGSGHSGCPVYPSTVELSKWFPGRRPGRLAGVLGEVSADGRCQVQREIRLFTQKDHELVASSTSGDYPGSAREFFIRTPRQFHGRVFAVARGFRDPRLGLCQRGRSAPFVIPSSG